MMKKYKVVFEIGNTKLSVLRLYNDDLEALHESQKEKESIQNKEGKIIFLNSVTQVT